MALVFGFLASPVMAGDRPAAEQLINNYYEKQGNAAPQAYWGYLFDLVTNAYGWGWGSVFVLTNYNSQFKILVEGYVVPNGANPGQELLVYEWLNAYEVKYVNLAAIGLGNENAWSIIWSIDSDFGSAILLYNTSADQPGIAWEKGWYMAG
jgi:hypothetical protein